MANRSNSESASLLREKGKLLFYHSNGDKTSRDDGIAMLHRAAMQGDAESLYILGTEVLRGTLRPHSGDRVEYACDCLFNAANSGSLQAKSLLNNLCMERYRSRIQYDSSGKYPLKDFEGKEIRIDRKGVFVPVDGRLSFDGEINTLSLATNINFILLGNEDFNVEMYIDSILRGFHDWEGTYEVFGGQSVRLALELTTENRIRDSVHVIPLVEDTRETTLGLAKKLGNGEKSRQVEDIITHRRSFAGIGMGKWSAHSTKMIWMQSRNGRFDDPDELRNTARHEFGHILGLGDLYASEIDGLEGVEADRYDDLAAFHLFGRTYHLVMCDPSAPVSNNDIEMVLLAFSQNRFQRFQKDASGKPVSEALGKGN